MSSLYQLFHILPFGWFERYTEDMIGKKKKTLVLNGLAALDLSGILCYNDNARSEKRVLGARFLFV